MNWQIPKNDAFLNQINFRSSKFNFPIFLKCENWTKKTKFSTKKKSSLSRNCLISAKKVILFYFFWFDFEKDVFGLGRGVFCQL